MQKLSIEAATPDSGWAMSRALVDFYPEVEIDEQGRCFLTVELGNDQRAVEVFAQLDEFLKARMFEPAVSMTVTAQGYDYRLHG